MQRKNKFKRTIGIMGSPSKPDVPWTKENVQKLQQLGFNMMQLNIAWGCRPGDEPLNLEDVVALPESLLGSEHALHSGFSPDGRKRRREDLRHRIRLCKEANLRTMFHFGAPYNGTLGYNDEVLANCLLDGKVTERYIALLEQFAADFPGVDDLLVYTYDADAWLCSEFGSCKHCRGIPLHERVVPFLHRLAAVWQAISPGGKLWWEPWELSAGQVYHCIKQLDPGAIGLCLHNNIAEVMATLPVDRFFKNAARLCVERGIEIIGEGFFGAANEEVEPYRYLSFPLVVFREMKTMHEVPGLTGIKEYFGIDPTFEDPNVRAASLFLHDPEISEEEMLTQLSAPYAEAAEEIKRFWILCSQGMELFPWEVSWFARKIGLCEVSHTMNMAFIRGQMVHTPSWDSSRKAIYMKTDSTEPEPWLIEDIQLRCECSADRFLRALRIGEEIAESIPEELKEPFRNGLTELDGLYRHIMSYAYHLKESNLVRLMRMYQAEQKEIPDALKQTLIRILKEDQHNQRANEPIESAVQLLIQDASTFLDLYFHTPDKDLWPIGPHSMTSR